MTQFPRLVVAGTHSGVGKSTVTIGLIQAFAAKGLKVQPFKLGPDYIDAGYHSLVSGRPCRNLDTWLIPKDRLAALFETVCRKADLALIEGVMGLYDGVGATEEKGSTAELAKRLRAPVLLVLDAGALSRSAAALVRGFVSFDPQVQIVGCFLNRVAGPGHYQLVKEGIERLTGVPVVGYLPRDPRLSLPERHLGLVPGQESDAWKKILKPLGQRIRQGADLDRICRMARQARPLPSGSWRSPGATRKDRRFVKTPIAVAMDEAFHFYYPENLELMETYGAEPVPFSPLKDPALPEGVGALYLGGGFPEVYAAQLAGNRKLKAQIRRMILAGLPTYAECGGLMVLTRAITDGQGRRYPMVEAIPAEVRMTDRLQNFGYKRLWARKDSLLTRTGEAARGHEFHHSVCVGVPNRSTAPYEAASALGGQRRLEGYARGNLLASYVHLHFWNQPHWARRFVEAAQQWLDEKKRRRQCV